MNAKTLILFLSGLFLGAPSAWSDPRVVALEGEEIILQVEPELGVRVGDTGSIHYALGIGDRRIMIQVADFEVLRVDGGRLSVRLTARWAQVEPGYQAWFHRTLERAPAAAPEEAPAVVTVGDIRVESKPGGGEVWLDGQKVEGKTPLTIARVPVGKHTVEIRLGEQAAVIETRVHGAAPVLIDVGLTTAEGRLAVASEPPGARVLVDGVERGTTPCDIGHLTPGKHKVTLRKEGFIPATRPVEVTRDGKTPLSVSLAPWGKVRVFGEPTDSAVIIDKVRRCSALPCLLELEPGSHAIRVERHGNVPTGRVVTTRPGEFHDVEVLLRRMPVIKVETVPEGAEVKVAGEVIGQSPVVFQMERPGEVTVSVTKAGYHPLSYTVKTAPDQEETLGGLLSPIRAPGSSAMRVAGIVTSSVGLAMAAGGGVLLFLADRDDSRADELHQIYMNLPPNGPPSAYQDYYEPVEGRVNDNHVKNVAGYALLGVGAAAVVTGTVLWILPYTNAASPTTTLAPMVTEGGGGLVIGGRW
jgi:hypothetical protein